MRTFYKMKSLPEMKFLEGDHSEGTEEKDTCKWRISPKSDFFMKLQTYYSSVLPPVVANGIAVTTPLIDFDKNHWIGIGRIKIDYKKLSLSNGNMKNTKLGKFMNLLSIVLGIPSVEPKDWFKYSKHIHETLIYFSFFYTVNKNNLSIGNFSPAYLPQCPNVNYFASIAFPMSIQPFTTGKFAIGIGIADIDCGIILLSKEELTKMMIYSNQTRPQDFDYKIQNFVNPLSHFD